MEMVLLRDASGGLMGSDDSMKPTLSCGLRYPPTVQQIVGARTASYRWSGRLRIFWRIAPDPWPAVRACRSLKGVGGLRISDLHLLL